MPGEIAGNLADLVGVLSHRGVLNLAERDFANVLGQRLDQHAVLGIGGHGSPVDGLELDVERVTIHPIAPLEDLGGLEATLRGKRCRLGGVGIRKGCLHPSHRP